MAPTIILHVHREDLGYGSYIYDVYLLWYTVTKFTHYMYMFRVGIKNNETPYAKWKKNPRHIPTSGVPEFLWQVHRQGSQEPSLAVDGKLASSFSLGQGPTTP